MPRGYRCILIALVGWLSLVGLPPQQSWAQPDGQSDKAATKALENIAAALQHQNETGDYQRKCKPGTDNRDSDLCAQWKAADAAYQSAVWTRHTYWLGFWGLIVGVITMAAAIAAAAFAKLAADHTKTGATAAKDALAHQKETTQQQLRPYVYFGEVRIDVPLTKKSKLWLEVKNYGIAPATRVHFGGTSTFVPRPIGDQGHALKVRYETEDEVLGPQQETNVRVDLLLNDNRIERIKDGTGALVALHGVKYEGPGGLTDEHKIWVFVDKATLENGEVMILNETSRAYGPLTDAEDESPELDLQ